MRNDPSVKWISSSDLGDLIIDRDLKTDTPLYEPSIDAGGTATNNAFARSSNAYISTEEFTEYSNELLRESARLVGKSSNDNAIQIFLSCLDRHGSGYIPSPSMNYGYTFITRPRLNLTLANLRQSPFMTTLATMDPNSVPFMIRALLDTRLSRGLPVFGSPLDVEAQDFYTSACTSPLFDPKNPFLIPLCNGLKGISGFPDFTIETETTEGDFFSSDFTFVKGSDMNMRTQELSLEFTDIHGCVVLSIIYYWLVVMGLQTRNLMMAYPDDIYENRLNYTVSIYRFITDQTRRNILWWAKATGCFPKSAPVGALFNMSQDEITISAARNFSIPFVASKVEVNNPAIMLDFNILMERYCPLITDSTQYTDLDLTTPNTSAKSVGAYYSARQASQSASSNYVGLPYIVSEPGMGMRVSWRAPIEVVENLDDEARIAEAAKSDADKHVVADDLHIFSPHAEDITSPLSYEYGNPEFEPVKSTDGV